MSGTSFSEFLVENQYLSEPQISTLTQKAYDQKKSLSDLILSSDHLNEEQFLKYSAQFLKLPYEEIDKATIDYRMSMLIPESFAREKHILPLFQLGATLTIATAAPFDTQLIEELESITRLNINPILTKSENIRSLFSYCYSFREDASDVNLSNMTSLFELGMKLVEEKNHSDEESYDLAHEAPIAKLVDTILHQAITDNVSDVHIEPEEDHVKIRFRIDGMLKDIMTPPKKLESAIISRLKILANLDITETRKPQDGRITITNRNKDIDFRVSTVRTISGEKMVLRILDKAGAFVNLENLGLTRKNYKLLDSFIHSSSGIIIVCGPTGSGKTSTLYSSLSKINTSDKNIITIEDPVEYNLDGINQIPANPKIGVDFVTALSAIVRQDPDVIMIGEIRDFETANIAIQASLTGHLVFTTLHTRNAAGAITRLIDMGIKPFLLNSAILGVIGQRLVRAICPNCKMQIDPKTYQGFKETALIKQMLHRAGQNQFRLFKGKGCKSCDNEGYKGRTGIFEIMTLDEPLRQLIIDKSSSEKIQNQAKKSGMSSMMDDAIRKIITGQTTLDEVCRVLDL